jgi:rfaE bifunctional protein kinase chain/domain
LPTVTKTRILAGSLHGVRQQVVRVDFEPETAPPAQVVRKLVSSARQYVRVSDALLVSDYGYGAATPEILFNVRSAATDVPVTVDSRHRMLEYTGVTAATPNEPEVEAALGIRIGNDTVQLEAAGKMLLRRMGLQALVITRGKDGMAVFPRGHKAINIPVHGSDQVTDVTGAGDTVIAAFSAAVAAGASAEDAARIANYAGGIVVMKRGTATVTAAELLHAVQHG